MSALTLLAKSCAGILFVGALGSGLTFGGYKLKDALVSEKISSLAKSSNYTFEYFLKTTQKKKCGKYQKVDNGAGVEEGENKCDTPWAQSISQENNDDNVVGLWVIGEENSVNEMIKKWSESQDDLENNSINKHIDTQGGISSLRKKCQVKKEDGKVEIGCKFLSDMLKS